MSSRVEAGFAELRKLMRRELRGFRLRSKAGGGGHLVLVDPDGDDVRLADGKLLTVPGSPADTTGCVKKLKRDLRKLGYL